MNFNEKEQVERFPACRVASLYHTTNIVLFDSWGILLYKMRNILIEEKYIQMFRGIVSID